MRGIEKPDGRQGLDIRTNVAEALIDEQIGNVGRRGNGKRSDTPVHRYPALRGDWRNVPSTPLGVRKLMRSSRADRHTVVVIDALAEQQFGLRQVLVMVS
jgi:hypothetical protein